MQAAAFDKSTLFCMPVGDDESTPVPSDWDLGERSWLYSSTLLDAVNGLEPQPPLQQQLHQAYQPYQQPPQQLPQQPPQQPPQQHQADLPPQQPPQQQQDS